MTPNSDSVTCHSLKEKEELQSIQPERLVSLSKIQQVGYEHQPGDFILVRVVWRSECSFNTNKPCKFILSDNTDHITAIFYFKPNKIDSSNLFKLLKPAQRIIKIKNLNIKDEDVKNFRVITDKVKTILLPASTLDIKVITNNDPEFRLVDASKFLNFFPFKLKTLQSIDECENGDIIDVIGHVKHISGVKTATTGSQIHYQRVTLSTASPFGITDSDDEFVKEITLFEERMGRLEKSGAIYALLNARVNHYEAGQTKSLKFTEQTIPLEITKENVKRILPPECVKSTIVQSLIFGTSQNEENEQPQSIDPGLIVPFASQSSTETIPSKKRKMEMPSESHSHIQEKESNNGHSSDISYKQFPAKIYNFRDEFRLLAVDVTPSIDFMGENDQSYSMRSKRRGIALIIHNYYFPKITQATRDNKFPYLREGSHNDVVYWLKFLKSCSFVVFIKDNVESKDLANIVEDFKRKADNEMDACVVVVLSHGSLEAVEMVDGKSIPMYTGIIYRFGDRTFPLFKGKPKIFFVQACQTWEEKTDQGENMDRISSESERTEIDDTVVFYATIPETTAKRDIYLGSYFNYVFVDTLMDHACNRHLLEIFEEVQKRLRNSTMEEAFGPLICCLKNIGFSKRLYFNPGI